MVEETTIAIIGIFIAAFWFLCTYIALSLKCFWMSKGSDFPRFQLLIGNWIFIWKFISRQRCIDRVRRYLVSLVCAAVAMLVGIVGFLRADGM